MGVRKEVEEIREIDRNINRVQERKVRIKDKV